MPTRASLTLDVDSGLRRRSEHFSGSGGVNANNSTSQAAQEVNAAHQQKQQQQQVGNCESTGQLHSTPVHRHHHRRHQSACGQIQQQSMQATEMDSA